MIIEAILLLTFIIHVDMFQVKGTITFEGGKPSTFPSNTWLTIKVQDTSLADASAVNLAKQRNEITNYNNAQDLQFLIDDVKSPEDVGAPGVDITISAVINVGWVPTGTGPNAEWLRQGDYLTTTSTRLPYTQSQSTYIIDVPVTKYN